MPAPDEPALKLDLFDAQALRRAKVWNTSAARNGGSSDGIWAKLTSISA